MQLLQSCVVYNGPDFVVVDKPAGVQVISTVDNVLENVLACTTQVKHCVDPLSNAIFSNPSQRLQGINTASDLNADRGSGSERTTCLLAQTRPTASVHVCSFSIFD